MLINEIKKILEAHLGSHAVRLINEKAVIFRCEKKFEDQPYQILYVDCSNIWNTKDFSGKNFEEYQSGILQKDYYTKPGSLQWNYYYAFVSNADIIKQNPVEKKAIEADELYARKLVLTPEELNQWLSRLEDLSKPPQSDLQGDLGSTWIAKLEKGKLDAIFLDTHVTTGVRSYMAGHPILYSKKEEDNGKPSSETPISYVKSLTLEKYRSHPERKTFEFGKVNLIRGKNGTGKTSLLEALELLLCGIAFRNEEENTSTYSIKATTVNPDSQLKFEYNNLKLFKSRDRFWYNNTEQKFNRLYISFNKYNFFNTDAAFSLANNPEKVDIKKALEDIALGEDVNRIELRLKNFLELFEKEERDQNKLLKLVKENISKEESLLKQISSKNDDPNQFLAALKTEASSKKFFLSPNLSGKKLISSIDKDIASARGYIKSIKNTLKWATVQTKSEIEALSKQYDAAHKEIEQLSEKILINEKDSRNTEKTADTLKKIMDLFNALSPYYLNPSISDLIGLDSKIESTTIILTNLSEAEQLFNRIDSTIFEPSFLSQPAQLAIISLNAKIKKIRADHNRMQEEQRNLSSSLSQLEQIIAEIKAKGREYLQINPNANNCPLCNTEYSYTDLVKRISQAKKNFSNSNILVELKKQLNELGKQLKEFESKKSSIEKLMEIVELLSITKSEKITIENLRTLILSEIEKTEEIKISSKKLTDIRASFLKFKLAESEFENLLERAKDLKYKLTNKKQFLLFQQDAVKKFDGNKLVINKLREEKQALIEKRIALLENLGISPSKIPEVSQRLDSLKSTLQVLSNLNKIILFTNSEKISKVEINIDQIEGLSNQYKSILTDKDEYDLRLKSSNKRLDDFRKEEKKIKILINRATTALNVIQNILKNDSKSEYLQKFINRNKSEIVEIFRMIHTPREFTDINFTTRGGISLKRVRASKPAPLNEISTGQRSALALSIFSALNRKLTKGPNILIFDDPVINVDDMNILSYLDYLREVAINGKRQIFFATANENLAFLFTQKFKFLGDEFQDIPLTRATIE